MSDVLDKAGKKSGLVGRGRWSREKSGRAGWESVLSVSLRLMPVPFQFQDSNSEYMNPSRAWRGGRAT